MGLGPSVRKETRGSQATPLAEDFLKVLQGQLSEGFGRGVGPLQRNSGTAIEQFLNTIQQRATGNGIGPINTADKLGGRLGELISATETGANRRTNQAAADLREGFGAAGARFGTSLARGEGQLRADAGSQLSELIAGLNFEQARREQDARQFDAGFNLEAHRTNLGEGQFNDQLLLSAIGQMFNQGQANIDPFMRMASLGIIPEEIIASPGFLSQLLTAGTNVGAAFLGAPKQTQFTAPDFQGQNNPLGGPRVPNQLTLGKGT